MVIHEPRRSRRRMFSLLAHGDLSPGPCTSSSAGESRSRRMSRSFMDGGRLLTAGRRWTFPALLITPPPTLIHFSLCFGDEQRRPSLLHLLKNDIRRYNYVFVG